MKEIFLPQRFAPKSERKLTIIEEILERYAAQGMSLTVRQLYYQLVVLNVVPNNPKSYKIIKALVSDARLAGRIDWEMIVDRARNASRPRNWNDAADAVRWVLEQFQIDKWKAQPWHVEVMVEKQALEGVLSPVCQELDITFTSNKGYSSQSMLYEAGKRIAYLMREKGKKILICYLGDHDPSGIDMTRDVIDRLAMFGRTTEIRVDRLALNMDQVEQYNPPENPAKQTDSRCEGYVAEFGESSWELDALEPTVLADLLRASVLSIRDETLWTAALEEEAKLKAELADASAELKDPKHPQSLVDDLVARREEDTLLWERASQSVNKRTASLKSRIAELETLLAKKATKTTATKKPNPKKKAKKK